MIIENCEQMSERWFAMKASLPSASNFDKIVQVSGEPSKSRKKYLYQLAGERITGVKEETYQNASMTRGIEMESEARSAYELLTGTDVETVGLCYPDDRKLVGASPDGLVGSDGGIEIKCPTLAVHVEYLLNNKLPATYFQQVQGCLLVTRRKWWDFVSYYPGMRLFVIRVERDEDFISALEIQLDLFCSDLETTVKKIR